MDNESEDQEMDLDEAASSKKGQSIHKPLNQPKPHGSNPSVEEFPTQLMNVLKEPLLRFEMELNGQEMEYEDLNSQASCSTQFSENCWKFDCDQHPLQTYGCNNGRFEGEEANDDGDDDGTEEVEEPGEAEQKESTEELSRTSSKTGLPLTASDIQAKNDMDVLNAPSSLNEDAILSPSMEFVRDHPSYVTAGPNPLRIPHDEILNAVNGFTNMFLAHEISVDDNFKLESFMPKQDSLEARVRVQMKRAFWDKFDQTFKDTPPNYKHALLILREIKKEVLGLLLPHNRTMRLRVIETLDVDHIEKGILNCAFDPADFQRYADFVIHVLSQLCCPARDPDVNGLRELQSPAEIFKGILETIEKMKIDMANFVVTQSRPLIVKQCVHYERSKFAEFLELEYRLHDDGLKSARLWLNRHKAENRDTQEVLAKAFGELVNYDANSQWPETLTLDAGRILQISQQIKRLAIIGACVLSVGSVYQVLFEGKFVHDFREKTKKQIKLIITTDDMKEDAKTKEAMLRIGEEMCSLVNEFVGTQLNREISERERDEIRNCIVAVNTPEHKIRNLMLRRLYDYVDEVTRAIWTFPLAMPPGLAIVHQEIYSTMSQFSRLINHQRRVFGVVYTGIIEGKLDPPVYPDELNGEWDPKFCDLVKTLREETTEDEWEERARNEDIRRVQDAQAQLPDGIS